MSSPRDVLPVYVQFDVLRYLSYRWKPSLIRDVIARRHGYRLTHACIRALRDDTPCTKRCAEDCWLRRDAHRPITLVTKEELGPDAKEREEQRRRAQHFIYDEPNG